jgi:hypothetical protein
MFKKLLRRLFMNKITVNGEVFYSTSNDVHVQDDNIFVGGKLVKAGLPQVVKVLWEGDVANVDCTTLHVTGDVDATNVTAGGSITARKIDATNVESHGTITAERIDAVNVKGVK